jgi:hypothetical protein
MKDLVPLLDKLGLTGMKTHLPEIMNLTGSQASDNIYMILKKLLEVECEFKKSRSLNYRLRIVKSVELYAQKEFRNKVIKR